MTGQSARQKGTPASPLTAALTAAQGLTLSALAPLKTKLDVGLESVVIAVLGDSTGSGGQSGTTPFRWPWLLAQHLAAAYPAYTVSFRPWNATSNAYDATVTVHTGTGTGNAGAPFVIDICNGSASGQTPAYSQSFILSGMLPVTPDIVFINHGHNVGQAADINTVSQFYGLVRDVLRWSNSTVPIVVVGQNPRISPATGISTHVQRMTRLQEMCAAEGWGFINTTRMFLDQPNYAQYINATDGVHPTDAGSQLWADYIWSLFLRASSYAQSRWSGADVDSRLWIPASAFTPALIVGGSPAAAVLNSYLPVVSFTKQAGPVGASTTVHLPNAWKWVNIWAYWTVTDTAAGNVYWTIDNAYINRVGTELASGTGATLSAPSTGPNALGAAPGVVSGQSHTKVGSLLAYTGSRNMVLRLCRDGSQAGDTYAGAANLFGLVIERAA